MTEGSPNARRILALPKIIQAQIDEEHVSDPNAKVHRPEHGFWLTPPEMLEPLQREFSFDYDPCPNPRPPGYDGLEADWGKSNWVNPPFWAGLAYWAKKTISEHKLGKTTVFISPVDRWIWYFVEAMGGRLVSPDGKCEIRSKGAGQHEWVHTKSGKRQKAPRPSLLFILRGEVL